MPFIDLFAVIMSERLVWQKYSCDHYERFALQIWYGLSTFMSKNVPEDFCNYMTIGNGTDVTVKECYTVMDFY